MDFPHWRTCARRSLPRVQLPCPSTISNSCARGQASRCLGTQIFQWGIPTCFTTSSHGSFLSSSSLMLTFAETFWRETKNIIFKFGNLTFYYTESFPSCSHFSPVKFSPALGGVGWVNFGKLVEKSRTEKGAGLTGCFETYVNCSKQK